MAKVKDAKTEEAIQKGRRGRLRDAIAKQRLSTMTETNVLEYALGLAIPRVDTHPTAYRLIEKFGSLRGVIEAHPDKLMEVDGMGETSAVFLSFLNQFVTYYAKAKRDEIKLKNHMEIINYLEPEMQTYSEEEFVLLCLDKNGVILLQDQVKGNLSSVHINLRNVLDVVLRVKTHAIIMAHNHPDGFLFPSTSDIMLTRSVVNLCLPLEIDILDHLIFAKNTGVYSFSQSGVLSLFKCEHQAFRTSRDFEEMMVARED